MTLEKAIKILNENVILSPKASKFKEAIEVVKFALEHQQAVINNLKKDCSVIEVNLEEAFLKECECEIEKAKEQAVREFAEIMKENLKNVAKEEIMGREYYLIGLSFIDTLVNEMFGNPEQQEGE
jgi:predicted transcriptional regulator